MGAVTNRRRPHNHESMQITSPGKFADHPLPRRQLPRLLPLPPAKSGKSIPEPGDGGILDNLPGMAEVSLPATRPAGQAFRAENRGGSPPRKTGRSPEQRRKLRFHVRRRKDGRRNDRRPGRQTPGGCYYSSDLLEIDSIYIEGGQVFASTVVRYHNKLGVVYFNLIRPFHVLVVKNLFKQMMRERGF